MQPTALLDPKPEIAGLDHQLLDLLGGFEDVLGPESLSFWQVGVHVSSLLGKLGVNSRQAAAARALRLGLVPDPGSSAGKDGELTR